VTPGISSCAPWRHEGRCRHQRLYDSRWDDHAVRLTAVRYALERMTRLRRWIARSEIENQPELLGPDDPW
jgi:hypothetical protein